MATKRSVGSGPDVPHAAPGHDRTLFECDVCIVGSGVAGAIVASECLDAGLDVVMLESGPAASSKSRLLRFTEVALRSPNAARMKLWYRQRSYRGGDFQSRGSRYYRLSGLALIVRGGSTMGWSGFAYRMRPEDFRLATLTGKGVDWPIDDEVLNPFCEMAERTLGLHGGRHDPGQPGWRARIPGVSDDFPSRDRPFLDYFADRGWTTIHANAAASSTGGLFAAGEILDSLETHRSFTLLSETTATRIHGSARTRSAALVGSSSQGDDRVVAVDARSRRDGSNVTIRANSYVLCAGGIETATLLLRSADARHSDGIGNNSGHVGRHLISHAGVNAGVYSDGYRINVGPLLPTAASRQFDSVAEQAAGKFIVLWRPNARGDVYLNACLEQLPDPENRVVLGRGTTSFGTPKPYIHFNQGSDHRQRIAEVGSALRQISEDITPGTARVDDYVHAHPMSTTRMSDHADDGVVDAQLRVHDVENLWICGSSVFPTGAAAHPTVTVAALAHRLGRHLGGRLGGGM